MAKEVVEKKGGFSADARELAQRFYDITQLKATPAEFRRAIGNLKYLLLGGYTYNEIQDCMDWLVVNKQGIYSTGYLTKCINEVMTQIKIEQTKKELAQYSEEIIKGEHNYAPKIEDIKSDNASKFQSKTKKTIKGI